MRSRLHQKIARWQAATIETLKHNSADIAGQEQYMHTYAPYGLLPLPKFASAGQVVEVNGRPVEMLSVEDNGPAKLSDVGRLEDKLDKLTQMMVAMNER